MSCEDVAVAIVFNQQVWRFFKDTPKRVVGTIEFHEGEVEIAHDLAHADQWLEAGIPFDQVPEKHPYKGLVYQEPIQWIVILSVINNRCLRFIFLRHGIHYCVLSV